MNKHFYIENTLYRNPNIEYSDKLLYPNFQQKIVEFKKLIINNINKNIPTTYYKFGDGDYYFLKKNSFGSAKPGKRALKKPYFLINHKKFVEGAKKNDYYTTLLPSMHTRMFNEIFNKKFDFPSEITYGLVANKWIFSNIEKIGIIGADKKLELIYELMQQEQYKEYLGIEKFESYIKIPQKFACDNLNKTISTVKKQIVSSNAKLFLIGVGHVKSGLLHELKNINNSVYLDIGVGIDAIAGIVNINRPYFGNWNNYQIKNLNLYKEIDFLINNTNDPFGEINYIKNN
jgi:hypothetical protein